MSCDHETSIFCSIAGVHAREVGCEVFASLDVCFMGFEFWDISKD